ncbi:hypothetical protein B0F90DRAFT_1816505 [Multifurca ochricompacta]|uniref:Uncharacterized protein n=1 Tax=Multifurca ochricompacta TaxID=376703 RepID=A0AAD4QP98_9AGAM|nr:hypothetical protein B0F90DRAFT_1816505 [Multifurca ochricompacta]
MSIKESDSSSSDITRHPYVRPPLRINITPTPKHWVLASDDNDLDINEEDGYILSANGKASVSGIFAQCDALSGISDASPGRLRIKPQMLHRRHVLSNVTSPTVSDMTPTSSSRPRFRDMLPPTPSSPTGIQTSRTFSIAFKEVLKVSLVSPPPTPIVSRTPTSPRQSRPILHVKTASPAGTSPPPPTPALSSPSAVQFRPSGRLPKRPALPVWPLEYYPRAVVV